LGLDHGADFIRTSTPRIRLYANANRPSRKSRASTGPRSLLTINWLGIVLILCEMDTSPRLVLLNTEQTTAGGAIPIQTTLYFGPSRHLDLDLGCFHLELGGHEPSLEESSLAPFYPDPSQWILAVKHDCESIFVMKTETLLRLAQEWGDAALEWDQWRARVIEVRPGDVKALWISGPRLFCMSGTTFDLEGTRMDVYDFSAQASTRHLETITDKDGAVR